MKPPVRWPPPGNNANHKTTHQTPMVSIANDHTLTVQLRNIQNPWKTEDVGTTLLDQRMVDQKLQGTDRQRRAGTLKLAAHWKAERNRKNRILFFFCFFCFIHVYLKKNSKTEKTEKQNSVFSVFFLFFSVLEQNMWDMCCQFQFLLVIDWTCLIHSAHLLVKGARQVHNAPLCVRQPLEGPWAEV